jgi:hypothetical protein
MKKINLVTVILVLIVIASIVGRIKPGYGFHDGV